MWTFYTCFVCFVSLCAHSFLFDDYHIVNGSFFKFIHFFVVVFGVSESNLISIVGLSFSYRKHSIVSPKTTFQFTNSYANSLKFFFLFIAYPFILHSGIFYNFINAPHHTYQATLTCVKNTHLFSLISTKERMNKAELNSVT